MKKTLIGVAIALVLLVSAFGVTTVSAENFASVEDGQVDVAKDPGNPGGS